ncbi:MAG: hypothetical protein JXO49_11025 [Deltaproteobacteria bacterium]|nr:hypothetical protein [Candidatus Anaeroferrophillus wilburensis]MBN2889865.1 hypothetical protein [Deltaproteobacteria bacterium]
MDLDFWLETFRSLSSKISNAMGRYAGTSEGALIMGKGAGGDMTLKIDKLAEDIILDKLETLHTNYGFDFVLISEELGTRTFGEDPHWRIVIDPLDGSFNARQGIPYYATAMAVASGSTVGDVVLGYVKNLANGDEFHASKGSGAFFNQQAINAKQVDIPRAFVFEAAHNKAGLKRIEPLLEMFERARSLGSTALDICYLAAGTIDVFFYPIPSRTIDYVAGKIILEEVGGVITGMLGENLNELTLDLEKTHPIVAAGNPQTMKKVMDIIQLSRI